MKLSLVLVSLAACASALVTDRSAETKTLVARECGAADSCQGWGSDLCNDRCKKCYGDSGYYKRGECGGLMWYTCSCYYD
ncbi:hypothetical protein ASPWEDRAFT_175242 [Aspergillus wentii DTO 134E9]|uniref:Invertebrate defensins family profile domain-containing protein n=1 Tax=Aspergillus wentii DTO 134E9 TaxID=1073089 RepID=A0A1L9RAJ4_ASPWE|nr:uncharacterized protein ASPWEDRAFT_175242 [Aspergillus wentii DTO 134E9]KAI9934514.1 hypothetical protein MW887_000128 [Aspergillus wentii]OJJ31930.1 hypothetical protein ASPWEDRAFT_175242 [Aspergillus wentii DTO 134E9]